MKKRKIGWLINGIIALVTITVCVAIPNPLVIFPVVALGCVGVVGNSIINLAESKKEKEMRENKKFMDVATVEDSKNEIHPVQVYEKLNEYSNSATFKGDHKMYDKQRCSNKRVNKKETERTL